MLDKNKKGFPDNELESMGESKWLGYEGEKGWYRVSEMTSRQRIYFRQFYDFLQEAHDKLERFHTRLEKELKRIKTVEDIKRLSASLIVVECLSENVRRYHESADWLEVLPPDEILEEFEREIDDFVEDYYYVSLVQTAGSLSRGIIEEVLRNENRSHI